MKPEEKFLPLNERYSQVYLGRGIHTLGLIGWILAQTGPADVIVTTFSTSIEFLSGFFNLRKKKLIRSATMVADLKASQKTMRLNALLSSCFENVFLAENHSKVVLIATDDMKVSVISSQNNTYGGRIECTFVTTDTSIYDNIYADIGKMIEKSHKINKNGDK